jgi:hypothetical protein
MAWVAAFRVAVLERQGTNVTIVASEGTAEGEAHGCETFTIPSKTRALRDEKKLVHR